MFNIERFRYLSKSFVNFKLSYEEEQEFFLYVEQFSDCVYYNHRFVYRKLFMDYLDDIINFEIFEEKFNSYHMEQLSIATKLPTKMKGFTKIIVRIRETIILVKFREEGPKKEKILLNLKNYLRLFIQNVN